MEDMTVKGAQLLGEGFQPSVDYRVKQYDFTRPDKFSKDQIRTIAIIHEAFARVASTVLSSTLRIMAHVRVNLVDQLTFEEFIRSVPDPTLLAVVPMEPMVAAAVLQIDPAVCFAIVDRLLGGRGDPRDLKREITDMERALLTGEITRLLGGLREAWGSIRPLEPRLAALETRPQFCQVVHPGEMVVLVSFATRIGEAEGFMNFCMPYLTIEPMIPQLSVRALYSSHSRPSSANAVAAADLGVDAEVSIDGEVLSIEALKRLRRGSLVRVPGFEKNIAYLHAGGSRLFRLQKKSGSTTQAPAWTIEPGALSAGLDLAGARGAPVLAEKLAGESGAQLQSLVDRMGAAFKAIEDRMAEIARGQDRLSDQLLFESPDKPGPDADGRAARARPFAGVTISHCDTLAAFLGEEHPQAIALVLSFLEPGLAACVLSKMPQDLQTDVAERICTIERVAPEVLAAVEKALLGKLRAGTEEESLRTGGVETIVEILNVGARGLEKHIVESLERRNPLLAEEIKKRMFVFEDIVLLDRETVALVLGEAQEPDLLLSLKVAPEKVRAYIWECVPRARVEALRGRLEQMGRARLSDVDAAQQRIVGVIRRMHEEGKIIVAREGEVVD